MIDAWAVSPSCVHDNGFGGRARLRRTRKLRPRWRGIVVDKAGKLLSATKG